MNTKELTTFLKSIYGDKIIEDKASKLSFGQKIKNFLGRHWLSILTATTIVGVGLAVTLPHVLAGNAPAALEAVITIVKRWVTGIWILGAGNILKVSLFNRRSKLAKLDGKITKTYNSIKNHNKTLEKQKSRYRDITRQIHSFLVNNADISNANIWAKLKEWRRYKKLKSKQTKIKQDYEYALSAFKNDVKDLEKYQTSYNTTAGKVKVTKNPLGKLIFNKIDDSKYVGNVSSAKYVEYHAHMFVKHFVQQEMQEEAYTNELFSKNYKHSRSDKWKKLATTYLPYKDYDKYEISLIEDNNRLYGMKGMPNRDGIYEYGTFKPVKPVSNNDNKQSEIQPEREMQPEPEMETVQGQSKEEELTNQPDVVDNKDEVVDIIKEEDKKTIRKPRVKNKSARVVVTEKQEDNKKAIRLTGDADVVAEVLSSIISDEMNSANKDTNVKINVKVDEKNKELQDKAKLIEAERIERAKIEKAELARQKKEKLAMEKAEKLAKEEAEKKRLLDSQDELTKK